MFNLLGETSSVLKVIVDVLGVFGILVFGIFVMVFVVDLMLSASNDQQGVFFNKGKKHASESVTYDATSAPAENSGVAYYPAEPVVAQNVEPIKPVFEEEIVQPVDFDKAIEEQKMLANPAPINEVPEPVNNVVTNNIFDEEEEDIAPIIEEVKAQALKELEDSTQKEQPKKVFKMKAPEADEPKENEEVKRLQQEREDLEKKLAELEALRKQDHEELLTVMNSIKDKEPVIVEVDKSKEEEDKRKFANIARMNARLNSIKRNTDKLEKKSKQEKEKATQTVKTVIVEEEIIPVEEVVEEVVVEETVEEVKPVQQVVATPVVVEQVVEKVVEKPKFKKSYYESRLHILEQELKDAEKELKANNKEFAPLTKVKKAYERDSEKLRRKELVVAKQKVALYGVGNTSKKVNPAKKEKLDENVRVLKELKDSVFNCEQVIEQNKDRFPILEKNNKLLNKQIKRLQDDIASVKEAIDWYEQNNETEA